MLLLWILIGSGLLFILQRIIYIRFWDRKLGISFRFAQRAVTEGESAELIERVENRKRLPLPTFEYRYTVNRNFIEPTAIEGRPISIRRKFAISGKRAVTNRAKIDGLLRGVYSIGEAEAFSSDLFHTTKLELPLWGMSKLIIVYPSKVPVRELQLPARLLMGALATRRRAQEDPFALKSIRPYEIYDSPRIINWKASAKTGELKVNQFENTTDEAIVFLLDMGNGDIPSREQLIRVASSLSLLFLRRGVSVSLMTNCRECITGKPIRVRAGADAAHQITVDENLAQINLSIPVTESFEDFLAGAAKSSLKGALPVVISADPTDGAKQAFINTPGVREGYFLSVREDGGIQTESGPVLLSRGPGGKEARL